ncbi:MAG: hypothetical protein JRE82_18300 [Deltaproteobacteria bacterium]|nr:hypothetical protein [Deltaproteobacteria bacterium]
MKNWYWIFMVLPLALAVQGCTDSDDTNGGGSGGSAGTGGSAGAGGSGGTGGSVMDADRDGIPDDEDPTPNGSTNNKLNGTNSGGAATVVQTTATLGTGEEDVDYIYESDLTLGCDDSWYPQGTLCDEPDTTDSPTQHQDGAGQRRNLVCGTRPWRRRTDYWVPRRRCMQRRLVRGSRLQ